MAATESESAADGTEAEQTQKRVDMTNDQPEMDPTADQPGPLERHPTDVVAFVFGIVFLVATAMALLAQFGSLDDAAARSWAAGAVLIVAGLAAVTGTIVSTRRRPH